MLLSGFSYSQKTADIGFSLDPGVSYIVDYFKEDWQPFRPSGSASLFIEKNGSFLSYGTSLQFIHLRYKEYAGDITRPGFNTAGMLSSIVYENQSELINTSNIGINFYSKITVKKFQLNLGILPFKEISKKVTYINEDLDQDNNSRSKKYNFNLTDNFGLGLKFELSYPISEKMNLRFSGLQSYVFRVEPVQFTFGVSYRFIELGKDDY